MASLYRRGKTYWVKFRDGDRIVRKSLTTRNYTVARREKSKLEHELDEGSYQPASHTPLAPFLENYCASLKATRSWKSFKNDVSCLRLIFGPVCAELEPHDSRGQPQDAADWLVARAVPPLAASCLEDISPGGIQALIVTRIAKEKIAPKTANRVREVLHRLFNYATKYSGYRARDARYPNPAAPVERIPQPAPRIRFLVWDQIDEQLEVLEGCREPVREMVATLIFAGLRREELLWLERSDVDFDQRVIRVRAKRVGDKSWQPKTRKNRVVPISDALYRQLADYVPPRGSRWYFPRPDGKRWNTDHFSEVLREWNRKAGMEWSCLDFRHTFGSHLAMKGVSLYKIATLMGNSPEICRRHYAALIPEQLRDEVEFATPVASATGPRTAAAAACVAEGQTMRQQVVRRF